MDFSKRLYNLRSEKKLSREKLGKIIGTSGAIIGMYERSERTPSIEVARKLAKELGVSLDFLVGNTNSKISADILEKIEEIQNLPKDDRFHLLYLIDNVLQNVRTKKAFAK